jgi:hypothetical protein
LRAQAVFELIGASGEIQQEQAPSLFRSTDLLLTFLP